MCIKCTCKNDSVTAPDFHKEFVRSSQGMYGHVVCGGYKMHSSGHCTTVSPLRPKMTNLCIVKVEHCSLTLESV